MRILTLVVALGFLGSVGAGSRLVLVCGMGATTLLRCPCPHADDAPPCGALEPRCCELRDLEGPPSTVRADGTSPHRVLLLARTAWSDAALPAVTRQSLRTRAGWEPVGTGPPIFLEICSYLI